MKGLSTRKTVTYITILVLTWGISWPIYKVALAYTPPLLFAGLRAFFGGLLVAVLLWPTWRQIRWRESWHIYCISALFNTTLFFGIQTVGLLYLPGGLFSVIVYFQPVLVGIFAWLWLGESMSALKIIGLLLGFLGVFVISLEGLSGHISIIGILLALAAALSWALGAIYVKKMMGTVDSMWLLAFQSMIGGVILTAIGTGTERWSDIIWNTPVIIGVIYGAVFGIAAAFTVYFKLVNAGDATKVASFTFLAPLVAVLCGTLFLNEPFNVYILIGIILIAVSIYLVNSKHSSKRSQRMAQSQSA